MVEDNHTNQILITKLLSRWGHRPALAENGAEAVEVCEREVFDLILMDLQMPVMGGIEATRILRAREKSSGGRTPIYALSAHASSNFREQCAREGMDGYLTKPLRVPEVLAVLNSLILAETAGDGSMESSAVPQL